MRHLILNRIEEIKKWHGGFSKSSMRWEHVKINDVHISEVDLNEVNDETLVAVFERIIKRHNIQM